MNAKTFSSFVSSSDNLLPVTAVGLLLHLLVTYGVTNKPFSLVSQGEPEYTNEVIAMSEFLDILHFNTELLSLGERGWRSGESTHLPLMWPGFDSQTRHMWAEFVVGSCPCSERFFSGNSGFPLSSKTNTSKFQFDLESVPN